MERHTLLKAKGTKRIDRTDIRSGRLTVKRAKKIPAHFGGGFSRDFNRAVDAGWRDFFERRGMPPPQTSSYIS